MADISVEKKWVPSQFRIYCDLFDFQVRVSVPTEKMASFRRQWHFPRPSAWSSCISQRAGSRTIMYSSVANRIAFCGSQFGTQRPILTGEGQAIPVFHPHAHTYTCTHFVPLVSVTSRTLRSLSSPRILGRPHQNRMRRLEIARICRKFPYDRYLCMCVCEPARGKLGFVSTPTMMIKES